MSSPSSLVSEHLVQIEQTLRMIAARQTERPLRRRSEPEQMILRRLGVVGSEAAGLWMGNYS
jgi:hypothetical protein